MCASDVSRCRRVCEVTFFFGSSSMWCDVMCCRVVYVQRTHERLASCRDAMIVVFNIHIYNTKLYTYNSLLCRGCGIIFTTLLTYSNHHTDERIGKCTWLDYCIHTYIYLSIYKKLIFHSWFFLPYSYIACLYIAGNTKYMEISIGFFIIYF